MRQLIRTPLPLLLPLLLLLLGVFVCDLCTTVSAAKAGNPYRILGVGRKATKDEIRLAYKKLARRWHPDKTSDSTAPGRFALIQQAYKNLNDDSLRRYFNRNGHYKADKDAHFTESYGSYAWSGRIYDPDAGSVASLITSSLFPLIVEDNAATFGCIWLIKVYSSRCSLCERISSRWEDIVDNFQGIVETGRINYDESPELVRDLGVKALPWVLAVAPYESSKSRIFHYKHVSSTSDLSMRAVEAFIEGTFLDGISLITSSQLASRFLASDKVKFLFVSILRRPSLRLRKFVFDFRRKFGTDAFEFGFLNRVKGKVSYVDQLVDPAAPFRSQVVVMKEANYTKVLDVPFESALKEDPLEFFELLADNRLPLLPHFDHHNYFEMCYASPKKTCIVAFVQNPSLFWDIFSRDGVSAQLVQLIERSQLQFGWLSARVETSLARFTGADTILKNQVVALAALRPTTNEWSLYQGELEGTAVEKWIKAVAKGNVEMNKAPAYQSLPFLHVSSEFHTFYRFLDWFLSLFSPEGTMTFIKNKLIGIVSPLLTTIMYGVLLFVAIWMLLFSPLMG